MSGYKTKASVSKASVQELSMPLLPDSPSAEEVVSNRILCMRQIEMFNHLLYLKQVNYVQTND